MVRSGVSPSSCCKTQSSWVTAGTFPHTDCRACEKTCATSGLCSTASSCGCAAGGQLIVLWLLPQPCWCRSGVPYVAVLHVCIASLLVPAVWGGRVLVDKGHRLRTFAAIHPVLHSFGKLRQGFWYILLLRLFCVRVHLLVVLVTCTRCHIWPAADITSDITLCGMPGLGPKSLPDFGACFAEVPFDLKVAQ